MYTTMTSDNIQTGQPGIDTLMKTLEDQPMPSTEPEVKMEAEGVSVFYDDKQALDDISIKINSRQITALIGPSGCGKSTFLRCLNRMNDTISGTRVEGLITLNASQVLRHLLEPKL